MDIAQLAQRLTLTTRQVRYVLDHRLVPGLEHARSGRGISRQFSAPEVFRIGFAALLRAAGFRQHVVRQYLQHLEQQPDTSALTACASSSPMTKVPMALPSAEGDGTWMNSNEQGVINTPGGNGREAAFHQPVVQTHVDLAALRRRLQE